MVGTWERHYDLGLFYKARGRFEDGLRANQRAWELGGSEEESVRWNLGICATGAHDGVTALRVWTALGQHVEMGAFGLPEGTYPVAKVRLAERPLAERRADLDHRVTRSRSGSSGSARATGSCAARCTTT